MIAVVDPFTYAVHAFKSLLLKNTGFEAIGFDLLYLAVFSAVSMTAATHAVQADAVSRTATLKPTIGCSRSRPRLFAARGFKRCDHSRDLPGCTAPTSPP